LAYAVTFTIGGQPASVEFAGVTGSGLDQFNVTVPDVSGEAVLIARVAGFQTQTGTVITVQK
jgi:uncharacterized protein (TIGR03437 family)